MTTMRLAAVVDNEKGQEGHVISRLKVIMT